MRPTHAILGLSLLLGLAACTPTLLWAADEEMLRLERDAFCQAMPYRCADVNHRAVQAMETHRLCDSLTPHQALIRSKRQHHEPIDAADEDALRVWQTSCREREHEQRLARTQAAEARARASHSST